MRGVWHSIEAAWEGICQRPRATLTATFAITAALLLAALVQLGTRNVGAVTSRWDGGAQMIVYLEDGVGAGYAARISDILTTLSGVEHVAYVPPERAKRRLRDALGDHPELVEGLEPAMFPASLEVTLAPGVRDVASAHPLVERLRATEGVEEVEFLGEWVDRVSAFSGALDRGARIAAAVVASLCALVVLGILRLHLGRGGRRVPVMRLLGATDSQIRTPLVIEGALVVTMATGLALAGSWAMFSWFAGPAEAALTTAFGGGGLRFFAAVEVLSLAGAGMALGLLASILATGRRALA